MIVHPYSSNHCNFNYILLKQIASPTPPVYHAPSSSSARVLPLPPLALSNLEQSKMAFHSIKPKNNKERHLLIKITGILKQIERLTPAGFEQFKLSFPKKVSAVFQDIKQLKNS